VKQKTGLHLHFLTQGFILREIVTLLARNAEIEPQVQAFQVMCWFDELCKLTGIRRMECMAI